MILLSSISVIPLTSASISIEKKILSPRQQIAYGTSSENVVCSDGLILMKKISDNSSACVQFQTAKKLTERGWGTVIPRPIGLPTTYENSIIGTMNITNTKYSANYTITDAQILNIKADAQFLTTIVTIHTIREGNLIITIPTALIIDPRTNNTDAQPFVLVDGQEIHFNELKKTSTNQTLSIPFAKGNTEIDIVGTLCCQ